MFGFTDPWLSDIFWHSAFTWNTLSYGCHGVDMAGQNFWPVEAGTCSFNLEHLHLFLSWFINSSNYMYLCAISTMPIQHHSPQTSNIIHNKHPTCTKPRVSALAIRYQLTHFLGLSKLHQGRAEATPTILAQLQSYHLLQMQTSRFGDRREPRRASIRISETGKLLCPRYSFVGRLWTMKGLSGYTIYLLLFDGECS